MRLMSNKERERDQKRPYLIIFYAVTVTNDKALFIKQQKE